MVRISSALSWWQAVVIVLVCASQGASADSPAPSDETPATGASAVSAAPPDETPPTAPGSLTATAVSSTQINLVWTAATDAPTWGGVTGYNIRRCQGSSCAHVYTAFANQRTYSSTGLTSGLTYTYYVSAFDAAGNIGPAATAGATTPDVVAPSVPTGLGATAASGSQIDLIWNPSSDNVAVSGYRVERCTGATCTSFQQIGSSAVPSYSAKGLTSATTYRFRIRAYDGVPNYSNYSAIVSATTHDVTAPSAPATLTATVASGTRIDLSWSPSTDNVGVTAYLIERCQGSSCSNFSQIGSVGGSVTVYPATGLTPATTYRFRVRARDARSNHSGYSPIKTATTRDDVAPSTPDSLEAVVVSGTQIDLDWNPSTDNVAVTGYAVERCTGVNCSSFVQIGTSATSSFSSTGLTPATTYGYRVRAYDAASNYSSFSYPASARTNDTVAPTTPGNFSATAVSANQIDLSWSLSSDNVGVENYLIERCLGAACSNFGQVATVGATATTHSDAGLTGGTTYRYRIRAIDAVPNYSSYSAVASATTESIIVDTEPPTAPSGLTVAAGPNQVVLTWTASTDNFGVFAYLVERCNDANCTYAEIASVATNTYTDTAVSIATRYRYRVRARDEAGNTSGYSSVGSVVPADCD